MTNTQFALGSLLTLFAAGVAAKSVDRHDGKENAGGQYSIGAMVGTDQSLYVGGEDQTQFFPYIAAEWQHLYFRGASLGAFLYRDEAWEISTSIDLDGIGDDDRDKSKELSDMADFDTVLMASVRGSYEAEWGELSFGVGLDISGSHDGYKAELAYGYPFRLGRWMIQPQATVEWVSEEINQYYYGVTGLDAKAGRPVYSAGDGINYELGVSAIYPFAKRHAIMLRASYKAYASAITDSPIVDRDTTSDIGIGYIYRF